MDKYRYDMKKSNRKIPDQYGEKKLNVSSDHEILSCAHLVLTRNVLIFSMSLYELHRSDQDYGNI